MNKLRTKGQAQAILRTCGHIEKSIEDGDLAAIDHHLRSIKTHARLIIEEH